MCVTTYLHVFLCSTYVMAIKFYGQKNWEHQFARQPRALEFFLEQNLLLMLGSCYLAGPESIGGDFTSRIKKLHKEHALDLPSYNSDQLGFYI